MLDTFLLKYEGVGAQIDQKITKTCGKKHSSFTEEINKTDLSTNKYKKIQSIDSIDIYAHGTSKDLVWRKQK